MREVKVRIAVAAVAEGNWYGVEWSSEKPEDLMSHAVEMVGDGEARYWLTATLPVPEAVEVQAEVEADRD